MRKRNIYKIVHFKGYYPPISFWTCPYFLRSTSDPIRRWIIGLVSDLYRRRVGGGTELDYVYCGNILDYRILWMLLRTIFVRKSELSSFFHVNFYGFQNGKCGVFNMFTFSFLHSLSSCRVTRVLRCRLKRTETGKGNGLNIASTELICRMCLNSTPP